MAFSSKLASGKSSRGKCSERKPHFFKVLRGDFKQRLKIPPNFMRHIERQASRKVILQGPNRSRWQVELRETITGHFLSAGWPNFVRDHSLKEHEFLVFRYNRNMHFNVMIFDTSACEKEDMFKMKSPHKFIFKGKKRGGHPRKCSLDTNCILQNQSSELLMLLSGTNTSPKPTSNSISVTEDFELPIHKPQQKSIYLSGRRPVTREEKSKAEKAANSFRSPFPVAVIRMTTPFVYKMFILKFPTVFSRVYLPRNKTYMVLTDPSGKAWRVVYVVGRSNGYLSGGWGAFARGNYLEEDDFCAFELISELELKVHIFRVVEETTPLDRVTVSCPLQISK